MARESKQARLNRLLEDALVRYNDISQATLDDRVLSREDRRFVNIPGAQWEGPLFNQFAQKPRLEFNKCLQATTRLETEHRNNRITVDFVPSDGSETDELAEACNGLHRADVNDSNADDAFDNAYSEAIAGGLGAWRLMAVKEDEYDDDDEHQRIVFLPIVDADTSVYWDLNSKKQDKSDAKCCFVVIAMARKAYRAAYGDDPSEWGKDEASWPKATDYQAFFADWYTPDVVYVAEYFYVDERTERSYTFRSPAGVEVERTEEELEEAEEDDEEEVSAYVDGLDEDPLSQPTLRGRLTMLAAQHRRERAATTATKAPTESLEGLLAQGYRVVAETRKRVRVVRKLVLSGGKVLEDCGVIPGKCIPVVPVYGKRVFIDNKERWQGVVRVAKDPQRVLNMLVSRLAEISGQSPASKPIFFPEEVNGFENEWQTNAVEDYAYLRRNSIVDTQTGQLMNGPVQYTQPPEIPPATVGLLQVASTDIKDLLGSQEQGEQIASNVSGKTVEMVQQALDRQSFIFLDNFKKAMKRSGEIWLSMAKEIYVETGRKMKTVSADGARAQIELNAPGVTDDGVVLEDGMINLERAKMDVVVDVGPSTQTKKQATVRNLLSVLPLIPPDDTVMRNAVLTEMFSNLDGVPDLSAFARKQGVQMGAIKPTEEEQRELDMAAQAKSQQPPPPQEQANLAFAAKEQALAEKAKADQLLALANTEKSIAETAKIKAQTLGELSKVDRESSQPMQPPAGQKPTFGQS